MQNLHRRLAGSAFGDRESLPFASDMLPDSVSRAIWLRAQFGVTLKNKVLDGGRDRDRTCDPYHVKINSGGCACLLAFVRVCRIPKNQLFCIADAYSRLLRFALSCLLCVC